MVDVADDGVDTFLLCSCIVAAVLVSSQYIFDKIGRQRYANCDSFYGYDLMRDCYAIYD